MMPLASPGLALGAAAALGLAALLLLAPLAPLLLLATLSASDDAAAAAGAFFCFLAGGFLAAGAAAAGFFFAADAAAEAEEAEAPEAAESAGEGGAAAALLLALAAPAAFSFAALPGPESERMSITSTAPAPPPPPVVVPPAVPPLLLKPLAAPAPPPAPPAAAAVPAPLLAFFLAAGGVSSTPLTSLSLPAALLLCSDAEEELWLGSSSLLDSPSKSDSDSSSAMRFFLGGMVAKGWRALVACLRSLWHVCVCAMVGGEMEAGKRARVGAWGWGGAAGVELHESRKLASGWRRGGRGHDAVSLASSRPRPRQPPLALPLRVWVGLIDVRCIQLNQGGRASCGLLHRRLTMYGPSRRHITSSLTHTYQPQHHSPPPSTMEGFGALQAQVREVMERHHPEVSQSLGSVG